jgi:hypothetical protein
MKTTLLKIAALAVMALASVQAYAAQAVDTVKTVAVEVGAKLADAVTGYMANQGLMLFATSYSDAYTGLTPARDRPMIAPIERVAIPFTLPATAPAADDLFLLHKIPAGVKIADWSIQTGDADTGGTPALAFTLGSMNAGLTDISTAYKTGITVGQSAGLQRADAAAAFLEASTAERVIGIKFTTAAATYAASKAGLLILELTT